MAADEARLTEGSPRGGALRALSRFSWRRPSLKTFGQISVPVAAFVLVYVAALVALLVQGFWTTDSFTGKVIHSWNLDNFRAIADAPYPRIIFRTLGMATAVTVTCMVLAFPYAYFMVRVAGPRLRVVLLVATVLPLWVSYLVRVYSWRLILNPDGAVNWALNLVGLPDLNIAYTNWAMWIVFTYIWFPFMVLPVYAALGLVGGRIDGGQRELEVVDKPAQLAGHPGIKRARIGQAGEETHFFSGTHHFRQVTVDQGLAAGEVDDLDPEPLESREILHDQLRIALLDADVLRLDWNVAVSATRIALVRHVVVCEDRRHLITSQSSFL